MAAPPPKWGWDLQEKKQAGQTTEDVLTLVAPSMPTVVSGFTPINRPQALTNFSNRPDSKTQSGTKSTTKATVQTSKEPEVKIRKCKDPSSLKSVISKKPKKSQTNGRAKRKDISQHLQRIQAGVNSQAAHSVHKSGSPSNPESLKTTNKGLNLATSFDEALIEDEEDNSSTLVADSESRLFSLAERYQAEYALANTKDTVDFTSTKSQQKSSDEISRSKSSLFWHSDSLHDFQLSQSAQLPRLTFEEAPYRATSTCDARSSSGTLLEDSNNFDFKETFDSDFNGLMASEAYSEKVGHEFTESAAVDDNSYHELDEWPDNVSMPDARMIYDEELQETPGIISRDAGTGNPEPTVILHLASDNVKKLVRPPRKPVDGSENEFDDVDLEPSLIDLTSPTTPKRASTPQTSPANLSSSPKLKWLPPQSFTPNKVFAKFLSKAPDISRDVPHLVPKNATGTHQPFARPPFPKSVRDRSPILGLTNATVLRTCFRIGEAINAAAQASRSKFDAVVELHARVIASSREGNCGYKQIFQFADLFTDRPPYLSGTSTIWKGVGLWDQDSRVFIGEAAKGKMCRVVGRIRKGESPQGGCSMTVLSIWEVDWEDVGIAKGVVCS